MTSTSWQSEKAPLFLPLSSQQAELQLDKNILINTQMCLRDPRYQDIQRWVFWNERGSRMGERQGKQPQKQFGAHNSSSKHGSRGGVGCSPHSVGLRLGRSSFPPRKGSSLAPSILWQNSVEVTGKLQIKR